MNGGKTILASDFHLIDFPFLSTVRAEILDAWLALSYIGRICWPTSGSNISDRLTVYVLETTNDMRVLNSLISAGKFQIYAYKLNIKKNFFNEHVLSAIKSIIYL